jgi:exodeoxyribonuclease V alpha subunit
LDAAHLFAGKNTELYERLLAGGKISPFLRVHYWEGTAQLQQLVATCVLEGAVRDQLSPEKRFNRLLALYDNGFVPNNEAAALKLNRVQLLTPYRGGPSGALGLSNFMRSRYRHDVWPDRKFANTAFAHSDKIIRINNWYGWSKDTGRRELLLSNGSIGVLCNNKEGRRAYFPESQWPLSWNRMKEEDFELAYGITVHTALTRSKTKLVLLVQNASRDNPLKIARERSVLLERNSSNFADPSDLCVDSSPRRASR